MEAGIPLKENVKLDKVKLVGLYPMKCGR